MGLKPHEYAELTPGEFSDMLEGASWADNRQMEKLAWQTAHTINVHLPRDSQTTPAKLLGIEAEVEKPKTTKERKQELVELRERFKK